MAAPGAFIMRNAPTTFDSTAYNGQFSRAELVPDQAVEQLKLLDGDTASDVDNPSWTFAVSGVQDWTADTGFTDFLMENIGETVEVTYQPRAGAGVRQATFNVIILAPNVGGEQGDWATFELEFPVDGNITWGVSA